MEYLEKQYVDLWIDFRGKEWKGKLLKAIYKEDTHEFLIQFANEPNISIILSREKVAIDILIASEYLAEEIEEISLPSFKIKFNKEEQDWIITNKLEREDSPLRNTRATRVQNVLWSLLLNEISYQNNRKDN